MSEIKVDRVGEINHTKKGETIQIIKYEKANNIEVKKSKLSKKLDDLLN